MRLTHSPSSTNSCFHVTSGSGGKIDTSSNIWEELFHFISSLAMSGNCSFDNYGMIVNLITTLTTSGNCLENMAFVAELL